MFKQDLVREKITVPKDPLQGQWLSFYISNKCNKYLEKHVYMFNQPKVDIKITLTNDPLCQVLSTKT